MVDFKTFRNVLGHYPTGVCVVTTVQEDGTPIGITVGSFTSVSLDPPLVAFFPDRRSSTWAKMQARGRFCVNVLSEQQESLSRRFATSGEDKFMGVSHQTSSLGLPILDGVAAWIDCDLHAVHEAGDHFIAIGQVASLAAEQHVRPLLFHKGEYSRVAPALAKI